MTSEAPELKPGEAAEGAPKQNWRSNKAREAIGEAADGIANCYCSEDDTFFPEVERLIAAISEVVDRPDLAHSVPPLYEIKGTEHKQVCWKHALEIADHTKQDKVTSHNIHWSGKYGPCHLCSEARSVPQEWLPIEETLRKALVEARGWLDDTNDNAELMATIKRVDAALALPGAPKGDE